MSEELKNSYFYLLPAEVLIKILSNVDTITLIHFCDLYGCGYFLKDINVIRTINLCKEYKLENISRISKQIAFEHVTTLNVNGLYWIQAAKLRTFVTKLVNLQTLYAIHTNLSLTQSDTETFSKSKIKKLGISINKDDELNRHTIRSVETLYVNCIVMTRLVSSVMLEMVFPNLRNLWIEVEEVFGLDYVLHSLHAENKSKFYCQIDAPIPCVNFEHYGLTTFYTNRRTCQPYVMCCEKFKKNSVLTKMGEKPEAWKVLDKLHCSKPYGPKDARRLLLNENTLSDILFEELNFYHSRPVCNHRCREAVEDILKSPNAQKLKKLCIMMCQLKSEQSPDSVSVQDSHSFSKKRRGIENSATSHPIETIFKNFSGLHQLEIFICNQISHHSAIQGYGFISIFENLQSLSVEIPITLDGSFLIGVLKTCKNLQRLSISSPSQHEKLNFNVNLAIPHAVALKDFRYENHRIQLDKLIESLCLIKSPKLERIVIFCEEIDKFSVAPFRQFLELNPQLIFLYFLIKNCVQNSIRLIKQTLDTYKKQHPCKVFLVNKIHVFRTSGYPIPNIHFSEMVKKTNKIASLNALEDFIYF